MNNNHAALPDDEPRPGAREFFAKAAQSLLRLILESELTPSQQAELVDHIASQSRELHRVMECMIAKEPGHSTQHLLSIIGNLR